MKTGQLCFTALLFVSIAAPAQRLPSTVIPSHYAITITPDIASKTFHGDETIDVDVKQPVSSIVMNAIGFSYADVSVTTNDATTTCMAAPRRGMR